MRTLTLAAITLAAFSMSGCFSDSASSGGDSGGGVTPPPSQATFKPLFAPLGGILPYPTDLFFNGSTDGTLNIPLLAANPTAAAMNELDGFSIIAPITVRFSDPIDPATINQSTVKVFEVVADPALGFATVGFKAPLLLGVDYSAQVAPNIDAGGSTLRITPLKPLNGKSAYLVVLTNGLKSTTGVAATPDSDYAAILAALPSCDAITNTSLNGICRLVGANVAIASNPALGPLATAPQDIVLTFSFSTQSIADVPSVIGQLAQARPNFVNPIPVGTTQTFIGPASPGAANIHVGTIDMPYYVAPSEALTGRLEAAGPPPAPLDQSSRAVTRYNPVLAQKATVTMPMIIAVPRLCGPMPEAGWPLVLYNIGLVVSRTTLIATADALTAPPVCHAAVAIDLPLHGITDPANPLFASPQNPLYQSDTVVEPTFNIDIVNNDTLQPPADGRIDPTGTWAVNLQSLPTLRANVVQGTANMFELAKTAPTLDLDGDPATDDIDETRMQFAAFSTGAIFGITYLGLSDEVYAASLHNTGVGVVDLLMEGTRGRLVDAGLAAAGIPTGSTLYYDFLRSFQAQVDAVDGWSYAAAAAERHPIHLTAIAGNDVNPPDQTVPPSATARLVNAMTPPMIRITETTTDPAGIRGVVYLTEGEHSSPLDPSTSLLATQEIQIGMATFFATFGTTIPVTNPGIIAQPAGAIVQP